MSESFQYVRASLMRELVMYRAMAGTDTRRQEEPRREQDLDYWLDSTVFWIVQLRVSDEEGNPSKYSEALNKARNISVKLYPNPANALRTLKVNAPVSGSVQIMVRNAQGQLIKNVQTDGAKLQQGFELDLQGQPAGLYFIEVQTERNTAVLQAVQL